jgi:glycosyltransferase involved in cell wall biosynthesis
MNILHSVEFYSPSVGGAQEVVRQISERLVQRGHKVTVATRKLNQRAELTLNGVNIVEFDVSGNAARGFSGDTRGYQEFLLDGKFDLMMNYAAQQWSMDLAFPILAQLPYAKIMIPCGFSGLYQPLYAEYFAQMPQIMHTYDHLIFHAETYRDIDFARKNGALHYTIIPNGASREEFGIPHPGFRSRFGIREDTPLLLNVSAHTRGKGHALTIEAFLRARIGKSVLVINGNTLSGKGCLPDCRWRALKTSIRSSGQKKVLLLNLPRPEVVAAFQAADLFVFGSQVEYSPLVLFEALASRTPFVTTACGNAQEIAARSGGGVVVESYEQSSGFVNAHPQVMAQSIEALINNPAERQRMAESGYKAWQERFTWDLITEEYERVYLATIEKFQMKNYF